MAWTTPRTWVTGEAVSASTMNTHIRDNLLALRAALTSRVYRATTQSIANDTETLVSFDAETSDVPGWHSTSSNADRIVPNESGLYLVVGGASFAQNGTGYRQATIWRNGTGGDAIAQTGRDFDVEGNLSSTLNITGVFPANGSTDYFALGVRQNSGGALNLNGGEFLSWLSVTFLGA